jgi:pyridoxine 4-dehydrogenase
MARSRVIVPIPGTSSVEHLEENLAAPALRLSEEEVAELESAAAGAKERPGPRSPAFPALSVFGVRS